MAAASTSFDIVSDKIKRGKCAVFCGAGISLASGLPIVSQLLRYIFKKMELSPSLANEIILSNLPFEAIMGTIEKEASISEVLEIFEGGKPNTNHIFLAKLVKHGHVNTICTTNFDLLIEQALMQENLQLGRDFNTYSGIQELQEIDWTSPMAKIIKIHGSIEDRMQVAITMQQVAGQSFSKARKNVIDKIFSGSYFDSVLIMGYSCSDLFDISPNIKSLLVQLSEIYLVEHTPNPSEDFKSEDIAIKDFKNPFKRYKGLRFYIETAEFVKNVWEKLFCEKHYYLNDPKETEWSMKIDKWNDNLNSNFSKGIKHHICARLLYDIGRFSDSIALNKRAITIEQQEGNITALGAALGNLGMGYNAVSNFPKAKAILAKSIELCRIAEHMQGEATQLGALAIVLHHLDDQDESLKRHTESVELFRQLDDERAIGNAFGNIGNVYNRMGKYEKAVEILQKGLAISRKCGNKQAEGSQLGAIATAYSNLGRREEALECLVRSIEIKEIIGDRQGECMALANISNLYIAMGENQKGLQACTKSLEIAKTTGNKQTQGIASFNIGNAYYEMSSFNLAIEYYKQAIDCFELLYDNGNYFLESARKNYEMALKSSNS